MCNLSGSDISFILAVATFFTGSGNFFCQWELYNWQRECLVHFIPNNIDLIPFRHRSFDVLVGMDWLSRHKAEIVCHEKVVRIPLPNGKILRVLGERPEEKVRHLLSTKVEEQKPKDIIVDRNFSEVFLNDISRLPFSREIKFHIDLIPGSMLVAKSSYRLAPSEMEELSSQLKELYDKVFMDAMNQVCRPYLDKFVIVFIDEILIYSRTKEEHEINLGLILELLKKEKLLTKSTHFLPIREDSKMDRQARLYLNEIIARHGMPISIISNHDIHFTSRFWQSMQEALGTQLDMTTAYHPQTGGQSEHTIETLEDMPRACVMEFEGSSNVHLPLVEFSYNNSYHSSVRCVPFEALYERKLKTACDRPKSYAVKRRKPLEFSVGDHVLLKVSPWKGVVRFRKKGSVPDQVKFHGK
nr:putative reverse transcriptase domain-containing protein [Tanacetum cinerariifolium]